MGEFIKVARDLEVKEISIGKEIPNVKETVVMDEEVVENKEDHEPKQESENKIRHRQPHNQIIDDAKSTECPECGKVFAQRSAMLAHSKILSLCLASV